MAASLLTRINIAIGRFEQLIDLTLGRRYPPGAFCLAGTAVDRFPQPPRFSLKDVLGDGFLWAVPKHRRSIEKRLKRKFGHPDYVLKIMKPKTNLRTCNVCGDDHEAGVLCPTCYKKVMDETKAMQEAIQEELKLEPVEKEVVVLYEGEKDEKPDETFEGKRIVEVKKPRPAWFSKNLLQQTTQKPATTSDVKPSDLG
ncbi:39S ribosomal protein L32, mitochondrial [Anoplophora glabripennis]|uniref:39S ribosomal protein L32, mitochondrial n=1 Tax=Anoplophora glabripennis TaxID=217634 RepID=UPI00087407D4|nr:39S ribosomal protein L32, mitochondrial [Anoplophora glabripennis]